MGNNHKILQPQDQQREGAPRPVHPARSEGNTQESESDSTTNEDDEEIDNTPLTRANIPKIAEAVSNNIPK